VSAVEECKVEKTLMLSLVDSDDQMMMILHQDFYSPFSNKGVKYFTRRFK
jgi:hypothetical protein